MNLYGIDWSVAFKICKRRLLSEAKLNYSMALEITVAIEAAVRDASELHSELHVEP